MVHVGVIDLIERWKKQAAFTPQGSRKTIARRGFPEPVLAVNHGKTKVWLLPDIEAFERTRPELQSEAAKRDKIRGYAVANLKKRKRAAPG